MKKTSFRRGDTLVEIMFAVGIFGLVAIGSIGIMNKGLYDAQKALEISMARSAIDTQAEALRFLHSAYIAEKNITTEIYSDTWKALVNPTYVYNSYASNRPIPGNFFSAYNAEHSCEEIYGSDAFPSESFVINTHRLDSDDVMSESACTRGPFGYCTIIRQASSPVQPLETTPVYPRILFGNAAWSRTATDENDSLSDNTVDNTESIDSLAELKNVQKAQGIWVTAIASDRAAEPEFYDFHIRTCWYGPGATTPTTISTTVRLFNPDH